MRTAPAGRAFAAATVVVVAVVLGGVVVLGAVACTRARPAARVDVALAGETMGSTWHVKLAVPAGAARRARAMKAPIDAALERINDEMSTYRGNSEISRFNAWPSTAPFSASHELAVVVKAALDVGAATGGAYDITIDPLIDLWGFDREGRRTSPPAPAEIAAAREHTGLSRVRVDGDALVKVDPAVRINLGGIAAGYAVDVVSGLLDDAGFRDHMVEITGELCAHGTNAAGRPWRIGVKTPDIGSPGTLGEIPVVDRALATSGSYHNFFVSDGKRYSHILDPVTGAPVDSDLVSVTVLAGDALTADGYDTPFLIVGEARARQIMKRVGGMEALFVYDAAAGRRVSATAGFPAFARPGQPGRSVLRASASSAR